MRILLVEDNSIFRGALRRWLSRDHVVYEASNVRTAIDLLDTLAPFDIIVTDYWLPDHTGGQLLAYCRRHFPSVKVVLCSGIEPPNLPFDAEFQKPVELDLLCATLARFGDQAKS